MRDLIVKLIDALTPADETEETPALSVGSDSRGIETIEEEPVTTTRRGKK